MVRAPKQSNSEIIAAYLDAVMGKDASVIDRFFAPEVEYMVNGTRVPDRAGDILSISASHRVGEIVQISAGLPDKFEPRSSSVAWMDGCHAIIDIGFELIKPRKPDIAGRSAIWLHRRAAAIARKPDGV